MFACRSAQMGKLVFYKVSRSDASVQVMCDAKLHGQDATFREHHADVRVGDIMQFDGFIGRSKKGELSVMCVQSRVLAPCLKAFVKDGAKPVSDRDVRQRQRYLDLLTNAESRRRFTIRSTVISRLRGLLEGNGYTEVETPILCSLGGGASAKPFVTTSSALSGAELVLRVAPELYLKMLLVGGIERVFEMGRIFRNEGVTRWHNPEFTMCEFYRAYADYEDMMTELQEFIVRLADVAGISESGHIVYQGVKCKIKPPFKRIPFYGSLQECLGDDKKLPPIDQLADEAARDVLLDIVEKLSIRMTGARTTARLLDKLWSTLVPPAMCIDATLVTDHPAIMSPLAKRKTQSNDALSERFELFVAGRELANGYTEQNDPAVQLEAFRLQMEDAAQGDDEASSGDMSDFITALKYGLPPATGCGLGIDRLCMLLADAPTIKDVILFPFAKPLGADESLREGQMSTMCDSLSVRLSTLNAHITCQLCNGYLIDATTVLDCLHTFCKSCLLAHFEDETTCPGCQQQIHQSHPAHYVAYDRTIQDLVYKLVPGLYTDEMRRRRQFYKEQGLPYDDEEAVPDPVQSPPGSQKGGKGADPDCHRSDEQLEIWIRGEQPDGLPALPRPFLRCSAHATVGHVKKYLAAMLLSDVTRASEIDVLCADELMGKDHSLKFVQLTRWRSKESPVELTYRAHLEF